MSTKELKDDAAVRNSAEEAQHRGDQVAALLDVLEDYQQKHYNSIRNWQEHRTPENAAMVAAGQSDDWEKVEALLSTVQTLNRAQLAILKGLTVYGYESKQSDQQEAKA